MNPQPVSQPPVSAAIPEWIARHATASGLSVRAIRFEQCEHWSFDDGVLRHRSGRFFSVIGYRCLSGPPHLQGLQLPMIDQPEVGILGFLVRRGAPGWEWLLQAKTEPGNVGGTQVGPSVQATLSNYMQVHGGRPTQMLDAFAGRPRALTDVQQSEQGDRFLAKYNRNMVVEVAADFQSPDEASWRWFPAAALRAALLQDYVFNTDARSVLFCADWRLLTDPDQREPFAHWQGRGGFGEQLLQSSRHAAADGQRAATLARLSAARQSTEIRWERVDLHSLHGWRVDEASIRARATDADPQVLAYSVEALDREVRAWCQPLLTNRHTGRVVLACALRDGMLQVLLTISFEPGFAEGAQLAPSWVSGIGHANPAGLLAAIDAPDAQVHARVMQSDEGGRFMHSVARYELIEVSAHRLRNGDGGDTGIWVSLATLRQLARQRGMLTNELRSAASLLLAWC
jgi:oxidase EvaA